MRYKRGYYDFFVNTVARYPTKVGIRCYEDGCYKSYSYSELYGVCEYISQTLRLLDYNGGTVGVITERNIIVPSVIAAAHKSSSTFMFIDPTHEVESTLKNIEFQAIIAIGNEADPHIAQFLGRSPDKTITILGFCISFFVLNHDKIQCSLQQLQYSFIAMTSGSSGEPKYIQVPVECIQPNIDDLTKLFKISPRDVIYFSTPLTFDPSMIEILIACMNGASLLIAPEEANILFPKKPDCSVTFWQTTPSKFFQFSDANIRQKILCANSTLRILALGGEPLTGIKLLKELKCPKNRTKIFTLYGLTEMSCWACITELDLTKVDDNKDIPLGNCLSETQVTVEPIKDNKQIGQIILRSDSRSCCILNKSKSTEVGISGSQICTGDLGEVKNGKIYYRGRTDTIIKRFGHKVNLHSIESTIMQCPIVKTCSCIWLPKPLLLVVYYTSESLRSQDLLTFLKCKLDEKHWPDKIIRVESLPVNKHGKISKNSLLYLYQRSVESQSDDSISPDFMNELRTVLNKNLTYSEVKDKDFFSLGGTSFMAVTMINKLSQSHPDFGKQILPLLFSKKNTIGKIIKKADKFRSSKLSTEKRNVKRSRKDSQDNNISHKKAAMLSVVPENIESSMTQQVETTNSIEFRISWSYDTGKCVDASPTLFETAITYLAVGSHSGKVAVFNAVTGDILGKMSVKSRVEASVYCYHHPPGPPRGVVGTYDGTIVCFTLDRCEIVWKINIKSMIKSKATSCLGLLYVASYDGNIRCIDINNGEIKKVIHIADQPISADLALAKSEYVLLGTLSGVCASVHTASEAGVVWRETLSSPVFARPVIYGDDKFVIFAEVCGELHCRTVEKGIKIWQYSQVKGNVFSSLYIKELSPLTWQMVFGCHDNKVYSIMVKNFQPSLHWTSELPSQVYATPCALQDKLLLAAATNGCLCFIAADNGAILSHYQFPNETFSSPVVYDEFIFIGCRNDHIYSLKYSWNLF